MIGCNGGGDPMGQDTDSPNQPTSVSSATDDPETTDTDGEPTTSSSATNPNPTESSETDPTETTADPTDTDTGPAVPSECNDGIDNDGDGFVDWQGDFGCYGPGDKTEAALPRDQEDGFTTFEFAADSVVIYVSNEGDDSNDGLSPEKPVATLKKAAELVRDGEHDFILLRRGDTWRDEHLDRFKSGKDAEHPIVIGGYGDSMELPRLEIGNHFINHNGQPRSHVALIGLHFVSFRGDPDDPDFNGEPRSALRLVGGGSNILVEGCHFEYGEIQVQSFEQEHYDNVQIRRNVIERAYHRNTCLPGNPHGNNEHRPSGMYTSHVSNLLIEGNFFDHNGWNPDADATACATIYNHNMYLSGGKDVVVRDNFLSRASSIHIKLRSDATHDLEGTVIENNFFVEGEIGISLGGNNDMVGHRFLKSEVRNNVMTDIGRGQPTGRTLAWGIELIDNEDTTLVDNLILNHRKSGVNNSFAISITGISGSKYNIANNLIYRLQGRGITVNARDAHSEISFADNTLVDPEFGSRMINFNGPFSGYSFEGNQYYSTANANQWFNIEGGQGQVDLNGWTSASGEQGAAAIDPPNYPDPERDAEAYAAKIGVGSTLVDLVEAGLKQSRLNWRPELTAPAINDWIREGFGR